MAVGICLCFWGVTSLKRRSFWKDAPYYLLIVGLCALLGYAIFAPVFFKHSVGRLQHS